MKKLINEVASVVPDALSGYVRSQPGLRLIEGRTIVLRADPGGGDRRGQGGPCCPGAARVMSPPMQASWARAC